jgi:hypothetical protein
MRKLHYLTFNWNVLFLSLFYIHNKFVAIIWYLFYHTSGAIKNGKFWNI